MIYLIELKLLIQQEILILLVLVVAGVLPTAAQNEQEFLQYPDTEPIVNYRLDRFRRAAEPGIIGSRFSRWLFG